MVQEMINKNVNMQMSRSEQPQVYQKGSIFTMSGSFRSTFSEIWQQYATISSTKNQHPYQCHHRQNPWINQTKLTEKSDI